MTIMKTLKNFSCCLLLAVISMMSFESYAQGFLKGLKKDVDDIKNSIKQGQDAVQATQATFQELKELHDDLKSLKGSLKSNKDFDEKVKVSTGNNPNSKEAGMLAKTAEKLEIKDSKTVNLSWDYTAYFEDQLFPSSIISMASYQGPVSSELAAIKSSALGFIFNSLSANMAVKWEIECGDERYFKKQSGTYICESPRQFYYFMPELAWNYGLLAKQEVSTKLSITFRVFDEKGNKEEKVVTIDLRSVNDCILSYRGTNLLFLFAAYVNEEHPEIDKVLREGLNTKIINSYVGYQRDSETVLLQVEAVWKALHNRKFTYSNIAETSGDNKGVFSQSVRSFDKAVKTSQANCVDGTVVLASILKKIGIKPVMVLVPGHCFLGFYTDEEKNNIAFLETTMLASKDVINPKTKKVEQTAFSAALVKGKQQYQKHTQGNSNSVEIIDLEEARRKVKPLPVATN